MMKDGGVVFATTPPVHPKQPVEFYVADVLTKKQMLFIAKEGNKDPRKAQQSTKLLHLTL